MTVRSPASVLSVVFAVVAALTLFGALRVVVVRNVVRAALYLVVALASVAVLYVLLGAEFVAWAQVLIYVGAIVILFLFGVMLTHAPIGQSPGLTNKRFVPAALVASAAFGGVLLYVLARNFGGAGTVDGSGARAGVAIVGEELMRSWVVPFEAVSMVLLAALIGGLVIARKD